MAMLSPRPKRFEDCRANPFLRAPKRRMPQNFVRTHQSLSPYPRSQTRWLSQRLIRSCSGNLNPWGFQQPVQQEHFIIQVPIDIKIETGKPSWFSEDVKMKAKQLREYARRKQEEEEKRKEREREKERIQVGKELLEARRLAEENERKRLIALRKAEKEEVKRAREKIRQRLQQDKEERRRKLGLSPEEPAGARLTNPMQEKKSPFPVKPVSKAESMRNCLRSLKKDHKDDDAKVKRAFQTLLRYLGNVAKNPDVEKFRKIRLSNPTFQDRVGSLKGGIEFLELCGFEKLKGNGFLFLPRDKVDMEVLNCAGFELNSAITNPFFGVL